MGASVRLGGLRPKRAKGGAGKYVAHYRPEDDTLAVSFNDGAGNLKQPSFQEVSLDFQRCFHLPHLQKRNKDMQPNC